ncbi:MAG: methyltransferase domain-containing protein [Candidatus Pacearchaeota archaeon]
MEYFFILGRNTKLSKAEVFLFLEARRVGFEEIFFEENILVLRTEKNFDFNIQDFGGVLKLGKLRVFSQKKDFLDFLEKNEFIPADKFSYSIVGNIDENIFIEKFKKERKKAFIKRKGKRMSLQEGDNFFISNADFEIFALNKKNFYLGLVEQEYNSKQDEFVDMKKPVRREELSISPRLSKILINLSGLKEGNLLVDPFCGIGNILIQALLKNISAIGFDIDKRAIEGAEKNLLWLSQNFDFNANYKLERKNSLSLEKIYFDSIVTEPQLGELIRKKLSIEEKEKFILSFEKKIIPFLKKFKQIKKDNSRIVIVFPCFDNFSVDVQKIKEKTFLKTFYFKNISFPIEEKRKEQFVNRQIFVFY